MAKSPTRDDELIARYIEPDPNRPGLEQARITGHSVQVWAVILYLKGLSGDVEQVAAGFDLDPEAVEAAQAYYRRHKAVLDNRINPYSEL